jgi:hypothetical protein
MYGGGSDRRVRCAAAPGQMRGALARALHAPPTEVVFWLPEREVSSGNDLAGAYLSAGDLGRAIPLLEQTRRL